MPQGAALKQNYVVSRYIAEPRVESAPLGSATAHYHGLVGRASQVSAAAHTRTEPPRRSERIPAAALATASEKRQHQADDHTADKNQRADLHAVAAALQCGILVAQALVVATHR